MYSKPRVNHADSTTVFPTKSVPSVHEKKIREPEPEEKKTTKRVTFADQPQDMVSNVFYAVSPKMFSLFP